MTTGRKPDEDDELLSFHDINPWAPVHVLVIPKEHVASLAEVDEGHAPVLGRMLPLIERGQAAGAFRADVPAAWHLATVLAVVHAASAEVRAGRIAEQEAESAVIATIVGAVAAAGA